MSVVIILLIIPYVFRILTRKYSLMCHLIIYLFSYLSGDLVLHFFCYCIIVYITKDASIKPFLMSS